MSIRKRDLAEYKWVSTQILGRLFAQQKIYGQVTKITPSARYMTVSVTLRNPAKLPKALSLSEPLALGIGVQGVMSRRNLGVVQYDIVLPERIWDSYHFGDLTDPLAIGMASGHNQVSFDLGVSASLVAGSQDSGKTVALKSMLLAICQNETPATIRMGIVDPHGALSEFDRVAHTVAPVAKSRDQIAIMIQWFHERLQERKAVGEAEFLRVAEKDPSAYPRLFFCADEISALEVLGTKSAINEKHMMSVRDLVKEGRKFRINTLLCTQKPSEGSMPDIFDLIYSRYVGKVGTKNMSALLAGRGQAGAKSLTGKGDFLHVNGDNLTRFQVAIPKAQDYDNLPRVETYIPLDVAHLPLGDLPKRGRPKDKIEAGILAHYLAGGVTQRKAKTDWDIGRRVHENYKTFAKEVRQTLDNIGGTL